MAGLLRIVLILFGFWRTASLSHAQTAPSGPAGAAQTRIVVVKDPDAVHAFVPQDDAVKTMVERGVVALAKKPDANSAWRSLLPGSGNIGLKVYCAPGASSGTRPALVAAVTQGLLDAGFAPSNIVIWDKRESDLRVAGFAALAQRFGVRLAGAVESGYDSNAFYDNAIMGTLMAGDFEFDQSGAKSGRKSYVSKLVSQQISRIIIIPPLLNHNLAGICGDLYSLAMGSVDNTMRFRDDPGSLARAVPEIYALPQLSDHVSLCIMDALIAQYEGEHSSLLHYASETRQIWLSKDPVALDLVGIQELDRQRQAAGMSPETPNRELFSNASLLELGTSDLQRINLEVVK